MKITKKYKATFINGLSQVPVIKFTLADGSEGTALLDTGSELTVFNKDFVKKHRSEFDVKTTKEMVEFVGLSAKSSIPAIHAGADLLFVGRNKKAIRIEGLIMQLDNIVQNLGYSPSAIIGCDNFVKYGVELNFKEKEMSYNDLPCKQND